MKLDNFTIKSQEAVQRASEIAKSKNHQAIETAHILKGVIEIERKRTGDVLSIYLEFDKGRHWYFFNYRNNLMQSITSNIDYNNIIRELKEDKRTVKKNKEGAEYQYIISNLRKKTDFLRRMQNN